MARGNPLFSGTIKGSTNGFPESHPAGSSTVGAGAAIPVNHAGSTQVSIVWASGSTGGQVDIEIADTVGETASWWPFQSVSLPANPLPAVSVVQIFFPVMAVRTNIKQTITGGSINSSVQAWN